MSESSTGPLAELETSAPCWSSLEKGDRVEIVGLGVSPVGATVDASMKDGSVVWLWVDGRGRTMILEEDGVQLRKQAPPQ